MSLRQAGGQSLEWEPRGLSASTRTLQRGASRTLRKNLLGSEAGRRLISVSCTSARREGQERGLLPSGRILPYLSCRLVLPGPARCAPRLKIPTADRRPEARGCTRNCLDFHWGCWTKGSPPLPTQLPLPALSAPLLTCTSLAGPGVLGSALGPTHRQGREGRKCWASPPGMTG